MKTTTLTLLALLAICQPGARAQEHTIKFATLAPEGSTWINVMKEFDAAVRAESKGKLGFKIYAGGVQGDEKDVLRKIKLGQLQGAGLTGNGLTTVASETRVLDSPFLFRDAAEVDRITQAFGPELNALMEKNGYVNLGWAEVGFVYLFTNHPVRAKEDLSKAKMWMWEGDPIAEAAFKAMQITPIPLSITDVLTSLQTKLIDGVYTSPLAAVALQWFTRVKYMFDLPLANATGAVIVSSKTFQALPADLREILTKNGAKYMRKLTEASRADNAAALKTLKSSGITVTSPSQADIAAYEEVGARARRMLAGSLFPASLLDRIEKDLAAHRGAAGKK
jgi:TRAP-type C4-dicarboxylate transport system substrate-binding protein